MMGSGGDERAVLKYMSESTKPAIGAFGPALQFDHVRNWRIDLTPILRLKYVDTTGMVTFAAIEHWKFGALLDMQ